MAYRNSAGSYLVSVRQALTIEIEPSYSPSEGEYASAISNNGNHYRRTIMITTTITMQTRDGYIMVTETAKKKGAKTNAAIPDIRFISVDTAKVRT